MERKHILDCYNYTLNRLKELSATYEEQVKNVENFALWNLPNDLAEDWANMEYFINTLYSNLKIDDMIKNILDEINNNFLMSSYGERNFDPNIWTHESLKSSEFWNHQRELATQALQLMLNKK